MSRRAGHRLAGEGGAKPIAVLTGVFFDTSTLLAGIIDFGDHVRAAHELMNAVVRGRIRSPQTAWHCCLEFYAVGTRLPEEFRLSPSDAVALIEEELLGRFDVLQLPEREFTSFFRSAANDRIAGGRIYDAHIAEIARAGRAEVIVTENRRDFVSLLRYGIRVVSSTELAAEM